MYKISASLKLACVLEKEENSVCIKLCLLGKNNKTINVLEFADITNIIDELKLANDELQIYNDFKNLERDIVNGTLSRFIGKYKKNKRLESLLKIHAKSLHEYNACRENCLYCNPSDGPKDFFPDFTFQAREYADDVKVM